MNENEESQQIQAEPIHGGSSSLKTTLAGVAGNILEWYDFTIFTEFSDIIADNFFPPNQEGNTALLETFAVFGIAFIARPLGGVILGKMGDVHGRKGALELSVFWMAFSTFAMGCLPTYETIGGFAPVLLILMRLLQGLSVGGQLMSSVLFTLERSPLKKWGWKGSTVFGAISIGVSIGSVIATIIRDTLTEQQVQTWGWRIPFWLGAFGALPALYLKLQIKEISSSYDNVPNDNLTQEDGNNESAKDPVKETFKKSHRRTLAATILAPTCNSVVYYLLFVWLVIFMNSIIEPPIPHAFTINSINGILGGILLTLFGGWFADWVGDYVKVMMMSGAILTISAPFAFSIFGGGGESYVGIIAFFIQLTLSIFLGTYLGAMVPWLVLITPPEIRLTSLSLGYNISLSVWGGFSPLMATLLVDQFGKIGPGYFISLACVLGMFGVYIGPKKYYFPRSEHADEYTDVEENLSKPLLQ